MTEPTAKEKSDAQQAFIARAQGFAYVWGRHDAGGESTGEAGSFAAAYCDRRKAFDAGKTSFMPNIRDAFEQWQKTGEIEC